MFLKIPDNILKLYLDDKIIDLYTINKLIAMSKNIKIKIIEKDYICKYCSKEYTTLFNLYKHIEGSCEYNKLKDNKIVAQIIETKINEKLVDITEKSKREKEKELDGIKIQNRLNNYRNKHSYKLLKAEEYEEPDLNNITIENILKAIVDSDSVLNADKKLFEYFYMKTDTSNQSKISSIRITNLLKDKMLVSTNNYKWEQKKARDYCKNLIKEFEFKFYNILQEYLNNKLHDLNISTTDELEILMRTSQDTIYKHLWNIHLIVTGNFYKDHCGTRSYGLARYITEVQVPQTALHKGEYLFIIDDNQ
jgi:hypothetical protein